MNDLPLDVRMCKECKAIVFSKKDFVADVAKRPPEVRAYTVCLLLHIIHHSERDKKTKRYTDSCAV